MDSKGAGNLGQGALIQIIRCQNESIFWPERAQDFVGCGLDPGIDRDDGLRRIRGELAVTLRSLRRDSPAAADGDTGSQTPAPITVRSHPSREPRPVYEANFETRWPSRVVVP